MEFESQFVLVTGGSDGIGKAIALAFAKKGANLWLVGRDEARLQLAKSELEAFSVKVEVSSYDLSQESSALDLSKNVMKKWAKLDVLVNNAGIGIFKSLDELSLSDYDLMMNLNVKAPFLLIQALAPLLMEAKASVINISSYLAERIMPHLKTSVYSATKGAINSLTKALAMELGPKVRINAVAPGTIATPMARSNIGKLPQARQEALFNYVQEHYPMQRIGEPNDIAEMVCFLASEQAKWITGAIFNVDGGFTVT